MLENKKITVIMSGGMDSTTLLYLARHKQSIPDMFENIKVLSINYGQKHKKELEYAKALCKELELDHKIVNIPEVKDLLTSSLTSDTQDIPEGHYEKESMKQTVVPNRNAIMLSIAYGYAVSNQSDFVLFGAHAGDHFIYPDCRPLFAEALDVALQIGNEGFGNVKLLAPFINMTKGQICELGQKLGVPYEKTWSCYKGEERPCLRCGTCIERTEAFSYVKKQDPLLTEQEWKEAVIRLVAAKEERKEDGR